MHFVQNYSGGEIDYLEKTGLDNIKGAYEFKFNKDKISKGAKILSEKLDVKVNVVNTKNYFDFI